MWRTLNRYCRRLGAQRISANLGPPGKILVGVSLFFLFLQKCCKTLSNFKLFDIEFELLALECGAPQGGRSTTERKAAGAQRPTPCEAEGRASKWFGCAPPKALLYEPTFSQNGAKQSKAKWSEIAMLAKVQKWGGVPDR